jgi:hypothetical protein
LVVKFCFFIAGLTQIILFFQHAEFFNKKSLRRKKL